MQPPKGNKIITRLIFFGLGSVFLVYGLVAIVKGHISTGHAGSWHVYYAAREPVYFWISVGFPLLAGGALVYRGIRGWNFGKFSVGGHKAERKEALRLGITVSDVERQLPEFSHGNRSCRLIRGSCARYSLPRYGEGTRSGWSLLQRTERDGAQLPNGYLLQGEVSDALRKRLTKLATEFSEDYFEFEGTASDVAVYWEEWGGASQVRHMHQVLQSLAGV